MTIFRYEMKQLKGPIIIWSISLFLVIVLILPVYIGMMASADTTVLEGFGGNPMLEAMGVTLDVIATPLGTYAFLTFYVFLACAINGMNMGLKMITKEYMQKTADFILTKPHSRGKVFISKILAILSSTLIIGLTYFLASWTGMAIGAGEDYNFLIMAQIAFSIVFIQLIFAAFGLFTGIIFPYIRAPLLVATAVAFVSYVIGSFSNKMGYTVLTYLSPYHYFTSAEIIKTGSYELRFIMLSVLLVCGLLGISYNIFRKKDIITVS
ncbi:MAG: ABC transporter permease subunit [Dethiobacteria bacterium]|nr:ABC transporter permease [Bacillota bacterium]MDW7730326.1 ABC transporter permease subunit [Bacillota bacterium]